MREKRRIGSSIAAVAALMLFVLPVSPAKAQAAAVCQLIGVVHLNNRTVLTDATYGSGGFTNTGLLTCTGSVAGTSAIAGTFNFCRHNHAAGIGLNPACHGSSDNTPNPNTDPIYDNINSTTGEGLSAHFVGDDDNRISTQSPFTLGGRCSFSFEGHAVVAQAEIVITNFTCTGLPGVSMSGAATSSSAFQVFQCGNELCFQDVVFIGTINVFETS